jgi:hypothetical protein
MLSALAYSEPAGGMAGIRARRTGVRSESSIIEGLGISPLRATGGPPAVLSASSISPSPLVQPAESGAGLLGQLQAQADDVSPLTAGLAGSTLLPANSPRSLGMLQVQLAKTRQNLQRLDRSARLLQLAGAPFGEAAGLRSALSSGSLDLLG